VTMGHLLGRAEAREGWARRGPVTILHLSGRCGRRCRPRRDV